MSTLYLPILAVVFVFIFILVSIFGFIWWMDKKEERRRIIQYLSEERTKEEQSGIKVAPTRSIAAVDEKELQTLKAIRLISYVALLLSIIAIWQKRKK